MSHCKYSETEIVQRILHEFCRNPDMLVINRPATGKRLVCMGPNCGAAVYDENTAVSKADFEINGVQLH
jgi:succinyl-CoA synthetase alpha subunit